MGDAVFIYVTNPSKEEAVRIAKHLLEKKLIACANIFPINSIYRWGGKMTEDEEFVLIAKTTSDRSGQVEDEVKTTHPYKIPCIVKIPVSANREYLDWLRDEVNP